MRQIGSPLACAMSAALVTGTLAQSETSFLYQGSLMEGQQPADGAFDMSFSLWDRLVGGSQVGDTEFVEQVAVVGGLFAVELDFGSDVFDNSERFLEIDIAGVVVSPRQPLSRTPYAIQTRGIYVNGEGDVGIGTTTPTDRLQVVGRVVSEGTNTGFVALNPNEPLASVSLNWANDVARIRIGGNGAGSNGGFDIQRTGSQSLMRILHDGSVGIGTTAPTHKLHVTGSGRFEDLVEVHSPARIALVGETTRETDQEVASGVFGTASAPTGFGVGVYGLSQSENGTGVIGEVWSDAGISAGVRGINRSTTGVGVFGRVSATSGVNYAVYGESYSSSGFDFYAGGAGTNYGASSSRRWKENVEEIGDPLAKLSRLRGVYFEWDAGHGGHHDVGMIAEEVGEVLPEIVQYEENGVDAVGMDYSKLTPLLVEGVNALREQVEVLRAENAELRERLAALESRTDRAGGSRREESR